jgi:SAM-dependent methyltransferase
MREIRSSGSVEGVLGDGHLYSDSAPEDYVEEADFFGRNLIAACQGLARSLLELGSGGGNNASHMKRLFDRATLVDLSSGMLDVSQKLNPDCEHVQGDMRTVRLGKQFDCVFVHDAVQYMTTESDLREAIETAAVHCRAGGAVLFAPDHVTETFRPSTDHGGHDDGPRGLRYLEWTWDPDPDDTSTIATSKDCSRVGRGCDCSTRRAFCRPWFPSTIRSSSPAPMRSSSVDDVETVSKRAIPRRSATRGHLRYAPGLRSSPICPCPDELRRSPHLSSS